MTGTAPLTDTSDMIGVHAVFRDALGSADAVLPGATGSATREAAVISYYDAVLRLLDAHHVGEDELLTPLLLARCTAGESALVERIAAQHGAVGSALDTAQDRLVEFRATPGVQSAEALRDALHTTLDVLVDHLDEEESAILPIAARHVSPEEWGALPGHALRHFDGDQLWIVLGLVFDHMTAEQRAVAQAHMPPPLLDAWREHGRRVYDSMLAALRE